MSIDDTPPRSRIETRRGAPGPRREFIGFNRARHAVLEAAILATRTHLLPAEEIRAEYARLQVIVDKTAGPREQRGDGAADRVCPVARSVFVEAAGAPPLRGARPARARSDAGSAGLGAAVPAPSLLLEAAPGDRLSAEGPDARSGAGVRPAFLAHHRLPAGRVSPCTAPSRPTAGLGSGTQLGLAVARALAELHGLPTEPPGWRGRWAGGGAPRSAPGHSLVGGFIVEGGRRAGADEIAPLLARFAVPASWRCVVAVPAGAPGSERRGRGRGIRAAAPAAGARGGAGRPSGADAAAAGAGGSRPARVRRGLTEIQRITGAWFAPEQGGVFAPGPSETLVRRMAEWGAAGVGQSSWGPAVYGLTGDGMTRKTRRPGSGAGRSGRAGFRRGIRGGRGPALAVRNWPESVIDSSFCTVYTGPSKPPAVGDLTDVDGPSTAPDCSGKTPGSLDREPVESSGGKAVRG